MPSKNSESEKAISLLLNNDISNRRELQEMVELASYISGTSVAVITLTDDSTQYFKFKIGIRTDEILFEDSFCQYIRMGQEMLEIPDTLLDQRFYDNKLVAGAPYIRFYAGVPLIMKNGSVLGSLCVMGTAPKKLSDSQKQRLRVLASRIVELIGSGLKFDLVA